MDGASVRNLPEIRTPKILSVHPHMKNRPLLKWTNPIVSGTTVAEYEISYKEQKHKNFRTFPTKSNVTSYIIPKLKLGCEYVFRVRALNFDDDIFSDWSPEVSFVNVLLEGESCPASGDDVKSDAPAFPVCKEVHGSHSVTLSWNPSPHNTDTVDCYEIFISEGNERPFCFRTDTNKTVAKAECLKENTEYTFCVRAVTKEDFGDKFSNRSEMSSPFRTNESIAAHLISDESTILIDSDFGMKLYQLECKPVGEVDKTNKIQHVIVGHGKEIAEECQKRYVLLFGQTGAGKSTIIELIVNHVYDVAWEDDFRLRARVCMPDEKDREIDQTMPQSRWITCYEIKRREHSLLPYDLVVIDTPGFNTADENENRFIKSQFRELIMKERIKGLHAVCFVSHSHTGRLTGNEEKLSKTFSEIFGSDIRENIFIFATCADSSRPLISLVLKKVGFEFFKVFKFNNTPFTTDHQLSRGPEQKADWINGKKEIFDFFETLDGTQIKSLQLSKDQIGNYHRLYLKYKDFERKLDEKCSGLMNILNKGVQFSKVKEATPDNRHVTICTRCEHVCCDPCLASWITFRLCAYITFFGGKCQNCPSDCKLSDHEYGKKTYSIKTTFVDKKSSRDHIEDTILKTNEREIRKSGQEVFTLLKNGTSTHNEIQKLMGFGREISVEVMINRIIEEKRSKKVLNLEIFIKILEKCKREIDKGGKWEDLSDLASHRESSLS